MQKRRNATAQGIHNTRTITTTITVLQARPISSTEPSCITASRLAAIDAPSETPVARDCPFEVVQRHVGAEVGRLTRHLEMHVVGCVRSRGVHVGVERERDRLVSPPRQVLILVRDEGASISKLTVVVAADEQVAPCRD